MDALLPILKDFGFPVALCIALLIAIRQQNKELVKAFMDRIRTLESVVREQGAKIQALETDRLRRADEYAHTLKDIAGRYGAAVRDLNLWSHRLVDVLARLVDNAPFMRDGYNPSAQPPPYRSPSSSDIPAPPIHEAPTDRLPRESGR